MQLNWNCRIGLHLVVSPPNELEDIMSPLTNDSDIQFDSVHCRAICEEVGHRLRQKTPPNIRRAEAEELFRQTDDDRQNLDGAPSIVPSFDEIGSRGGICRTLAPLRKPTA
jgi:hypothetical protein